MASSYFRQKTEASKTATCVLDDGPAIFSVYLRKWLCSGGSFFFWQAYPEERATVVPCPMSFPVGKRVTDCDKRR